MPIMTLNDRFVLIGSHMESIKRAVTRGDYDAVSGFLAAIAEVAAEGSEIAKDMAAPDSGPTLEPSP